MLVNMFRIDRKNVGDWWSPPFRYFPFSSHRQIDIRDIDRLPNEKGVIIFGGGGLGQPGFMPFIEKLTRPDRQYKLIAWGVGADTYTDRGTRMTEGRDMETLTSYLSEFDEIGTRIYSPSNYGNDGRFQWVPCASCLSPIFSEFRSRPAREKLGVYEHLRVPVTPHLQTGSRIKARFFGPYPVTSNRGTDLRAKLSFMSRFETIVTNSYHGVYWATLLGRKVVCVAFKNGLFSFKHPPAYLGSNGLSDAVAQAVTYPTALEDCRKSNIDFYLHLVQKYGDI